MNAILRLMTRVIPAMAGVTLALGFTLAANAAEPVANPQRGEIQFYACRGCHAIPGYANAYPSYPVPRLAGQSAEYLTAALAAYQQGERQHGSMNANAGNLTPQDRIDIAAYLSRLVVADANGRVHGNVVAGKRKSVVCQSCHGANGMGITPTFPHLAGQYEAYLRQALKAYRSQSRVNVLMNGFAQGLSDQDIADLSAYYASQPSVLGTVR